MKKKLSIVAFIIATQIAFAQTKISIDSISAHMGEQVQICSKIYGINANDKIFFINLGAAYPNARLTVLIFAKNMANFKDTLQTLGNKQICVTGKLVDYKGKPEIVLIKPEDIIVQ